MSSVASAQLPCYKPHREVIADSITAICDNYILLSTGIRLELVDDGSYTFLGAQVSLSSRKPVIGDYYMWDDNGEDAWMSKAKFDYNFERM